MIDLDTSDLLADFERDGFIVVRKAIGREIFEPLLNAVGQGALVVLDQDGNRQEVNTWTWCGDDLIGRLPRVDSLVALATVLVGEPVYHWHSKLSWKRPHTAGTWDWHQDYAFWAEEGCAEPSMVTVSIVLDEQDRDNGCLRLIPGSHRHGVISHPQVGAGRAADPSAVDRLAATESVVDIELEPGDLVAFHCNTLHGSGPNTSERMRTLFHASYNAVSNAATAPFIDGHQLNDLKRVPDDAVLPGAYPSIFGDTQFIRADNTGYGGRSGYQVLSAEAL